MAAPWTILVASLLVLAHVTVADILEGAPGDLPYPRTAASPLPTPSPRPYLTPYPVPDRKEVVFSKYNLTRYRPGLVQCPCSRTSRGFSMGYVLPNGTDKLSVLNSLADDENMARIKAKYLYDECAYKHGHEACVNWASATIFMGKYALCMADRITGRNVIKQGGNLVKTVGACNERNYTTSSKSWLHDGRKFAVKKKKKREEEDKVEEEQSWFEGCVDIEHLKNENYMAHSVNLLKPVLCMRNDGDTFCATRNHAIVYKNEWTSLGSVCEKAKCWREMKYVNNLSVFSRNRYKWIHRHIIISPYDIRVPRFMTWLFQIAEVAIPRPHNLGIFVLHAQLYLASGRTIRKMYAI